MRARRPGAVGARQPVTEQGTARRPPPHRSGLPLPAGSPSGRPPARSVSATTPGDVLPTSLCASQLKLEQQPTQARQDTASSEDNEKRWLYSQIEALQTRIQRLESAQVSFESVVSVAACPDTASPPAAEAAAGQPPPAPPAEHGAQPLPATGAAAGQPPPAEGSAQKQQQQMDPLSLGQHQMDTSSCSSDDEEEEEEEEDERHDSCDEEAAAGSEAPPPRRCPLSAVGGLAWPDSPLWHSGPSSIGAADVGPLHLPLHVGPLHLPLDEQTTRCPSAPLQPPTAAGPLLQLLHTQDGRLTSSTLLSMSSSAESCAALRHAGGLPLVVQLIHAPQTSPPAGHRPRPDSQIRSSAAHALHNLVHSQSDDRRARREARVLRLLEQLRAFTEELWRRIDEQGHGMIMEDSLDRHPVPTVVALMKLSFDEEHRAVMCRLGGLHTVAELIQADHEAHGSATAHLTCNSTRRFAGMTLTNLTFGDGANKAVLCGLRGFMRALVAQLHSANEDLTQVTASVLRNLSWRADTASKQTLREVGAVTALTQAAMAAEREATLKSVLSALWNLSAHCGMNKADICAVDGALAFLVQTLTYESPSNTTAIVENGGGILRNMSSHIAGREDYRDILRQHNCLQTLLHQLRSSSLTIVSNACGTLWNLSARCVQDQRTLWELGAVSMLRSLIHSRHQMIAMGSSAALKNLLAGRPEDVPPPDAASGGGTPGLPGRRLRALQADLAGRLTETCDNLDAASAGRPEARFLVAGAEPEAAAGRVPRSDSHDSVRSTLSDPGFCRRMGGGAGGGGDGDVQLAAAVAQVARHAGVTETELRRLLLRPRAAGWTGSLPRVCEPPPPISRPEQRSSHVINSSSGDHPSRDQHSPPAAAAAEADADADSDSDTVRVYTTDSTLSVISTDASLRSSLLEKRPVSAARWHQGSDSQDMSQGSSSVSAVSSFPASDTASWSNTTDSDELPRAGSPPQRPTPQAGSDSSASVCASPRPLRRLVLPSGLSRPVQVSSKVATRASPTGDSGQQDVQSPRSAVAAANVGGAIAQCADDLSASPKPTRRPAVRDLSGGAAGAPSPPATRRRAGSDLPPAAHSVPASPLLQQRRPRERAPSPGQTKSPCHLARSPSQTRSWRDAARSPGHSRSFRDVSRSPSQTRASPQRPMKSATFSTQQRPGASDGGVHGRQSPETGPEPATNATSTDSLPPAGHMSSVSSGRQSAPPADKHQQPAIHSSRRINAASQESRIGRSAGSRLPQPGSRLPQPGSRLPQPGSRLPQRVASSSSPTGRAAQTWSVQQYHKRSERRPDAGDGGGKLTVEDLEAESGLPCPDRGHTTLPPDWRMGCGASDQATHTDDVGGVRAPGGRGWRRSRMCASAERPLSGDSSSSCSSLSDDEHREPRALRRCLRAALPTSRSETSCLARPRTDRRRQRRSPSADETSPPPPVVEPPQPLWLPPEVPQRREPAVTSPVPAAAAGRDSTQCCWAGSEPARAVTPRPEPPRAVTPRPEPPLAVTPRPEPPRAVTPRPEPPRAVTLRSELPLAVTPRPEPSLAVTPRPECSPPQAAEPADCMTSSQRLARDASVVAAALEMSRAVMAHSSDLTSSLELLDGVGPPSMMDSGASFNGFLSSGSLSNGRSPLLPRRPSGAAGNNGAGGGGSRFVPELMRRALAPHVMQESAEGLSSMSSCQSNLDQVKPPSYMEELDMENSMLSLESLRSEVAESRVAAADNLAQLEPPTLFHELGIAGGGERCDSETLGSDTELCGQEDLPLDPTPDLPLDPRSAEPSPLVARRRTARERRRTSPHRYRTFTSRPAAAAVVSDDTSSAGEMTLTLTPGGAADFSAATDTDDTLCASKPSTGADSAAARRTCRQRRQQEQGRYRTQTVDTSYSDSLQRPSVDEPPPQSQRQQQQTPLRSNAELRLLAQQALQPPPSGRLDLRQLAQEAQKAIVCLRTAGRTATADGGSQLPYFPAVPPLQRRLIVAPPPPAPAAAVTGSAHHDERGQDLEDEAETERQQERPSETPVRQRPRIVKPGDEAHRESPEEQSEPRAIRGKRKPLYSAPRRTAVSRPEQRTAAPSRPNTGIARSSSTTAPSACPVRGTKTTQLRKVLNGTAAAAGGLLSRGSRSATPSPASSANCSPQLGLRRFGSAGKAGVVNRELPRPASTPTAAAAGTGRGQAAAGRTTPRRPVSVPVQSLRLQQRPAWMGAVRTSRPAAVGSGARPASTTAAPAIASPVVTAATPAAASPAGTAASPDAVSPAAKAASDADTVLEEADPASPAPPPPPLVKQGTFTLDEPTQDKTATDRARSHCRPQQQQHPPPHSQPALATAGQLARSSSASAAAASGGCRPLPKCQSGHPLSTATTTPVRSRIPKSPSYESSLTLRQRCSSQSPGARRQRPASPRRGGRQLRQSASNSSLSARKVSARPSGVAAGGGGERSFSSSSVSSSGSGRQEEAATGKIAALWRRIEESRARQQQQQKPAAAGSDGRVWIKSGGAGTPSPADANANREPAGRRGGSGRLTDGAVPAARLVFSAQAGWRRVMTPAQSPTDARPAHTTAVIPPYNYSPPQAAGGGADGDKRKRKSAALSAT